MSEETTLITIPRAEYNALLRAAQIVIGLSKVGVYTDDDGANILIDQARELAKKL